MQLEHNPFQSELSTNNHYNRAGDHTQALFEDAYRSMNTPTANPMESFVAAQQGNQLQRTTINADWIRNNFNGQQQRDLLDLFNRHHISDIRLGQAGRDGNRPVTINFDGQMNIPGVGDFQSLSGTLQMTQNGFRITNPRMDGRRISLGGVNITELEYNTSWFCHFCANGIIPIPGQSEMCGAIRRALR